MWAVLNVLKNNSENRVTSSLLVWGPDLFLREGRGRGKRVWRLLQHFRVLLECDIGGYKEGVNVEILSFHLYLNSIGCNPNSTEAILAFHWEDMHFIGSDYIPLKHTEMLI